MIDRVKREPRSTLIKTTEQIEKLRAAGKLVAETLAYLSEHVKPGVTTLELDQLADKFIRQHGAIPPFRGYQGADASAPPFPGTICASINEVICHGIPANRALEVGDIISIDVGVLLDGWCGDSCATFAVGTLDPVTQRLVDVTREALKRGIAAAGPNKRLGDIGAAIQRYVESRGFSVVRDLTGHGIGREMHEEGLAVFHFGKPNTGLLLRPGMVFTIEPMVNVGTYRTQTLPDGWTIVTADRKRSAQFEHTVAITETGVDILSLR